MAFESELAFWKYEECINHVTCSFNLPRYRHIGLCLIN